MSIKRIPKGFTLVELLVVIGIIAVLISILLPSLQKARQEANLIYCASNLRNIGQALQMYTSENNGCLPYGMGMYNMNYSDNFNSGPAFYNTWGWIWCDTLSLMISNHPDNFPNPDASAGNGIPAGEPNQALDYSAVFHDVDTPDFPRVIRESDYTGNPRVFFNQWEGDYWKNYSGTPQSGPKNSTTLPPAWCRSYYPRKIADIKENTKVACIWDSALNLSSNPGFIGQGVDFNLPIALDHWQYDQAPPATSWGYGYVYAVPNGRYSNPIGLGGGNATDNSAFSQAPPVTLSGLKYDNSDFTSGKYGPSDRGDEYACQMRFRHLSNTAVNLLFLDGHVESRNLGEVTARDISVNAIVPDGP